MSSVQFLAFLVALVDLVTGGLISNGFIVKVIFVEWASSRILASNEQLLLSLGISNICIATALSASMLNSYLVVINSVVLLYSFVSFFTVFRFWNTAWISFFYCIKIVNSSCSFFLWCKLKISWLIPRLLLGSLAMSLATFIFTFQNILIYDLGNGTTNGMGMRQGTTEKVYGASFKLSVLFVGFSCPLLVVLFCSVLVVASLYRHICRMTGKEYNLRSLQTKVHIKAAGTILSLLLLYVSFYMAQTLIMTADLRGFQMTLTALIKLMNGSLQAVILILSNPKLKQAATQMLQRPTFLRTK